MRRVLQIAFVVAAVCLVFGRTFGYGLVNCDDYDYVLKYEWVTRGLTAFGVRWAFTNVSEAIWMPLTWVSYMVDYDVTRLLGLFDPSAEGWGVARVMHVHSVLLHAANAVLLFLLLVRIQRLVPLQGQDTRSSDTKEAPPLQTPTAKTPVALMALVATLLWAIHPLRVESVAWVASRKDVLSLFWELLAFHTWLGGMFLTRSQCGRYRQIFAGITAMTCFAAACCAKPSAMTFPLLLFILDRFVLRRRLNWLAYVPFLVVGVFVGVLAAWAQHAGGATQALSAVPLWWRLLNAMAAFGIYVWHEVWPTNLAVQCLARWPALPRFLMPGVCISLAVVWYLVRRVKFACLHDSTFKQSPRFTDFLFAAVLWWCIALVPFLGLANFGVHAFADRFTYVPSVGLAFLVLWGVCQYRTRLAIGLGSGLCIFYGVAAWCQTRFWTDDGALYARTLAVDGDGNSEAHVSLAMWAWEFPHDLPYAIQHFRAGWELDVARAGRSGHLFVMALCEQGELDEARERLVQLGTWSEQQAARHRLLSGGHSRTTLNYQVARAYYLSCQDATRSLAVDICKQLEEIAPAHPDVLYLRLRMAGLSGDAVAAHEIRQKLSSLTGEYLHYRFLSQPANHDAPMRCIPKTT